MPSPRPHFVFPFLIAALLSGCDFGYVVWLPDSSGFLYTTPQRELIRVDVDRTRRRVLVADTGTLTVLPALSPDAKRIAAAQLFGQPQASDTGSPGPDMLRITVYDLDGAEVHRSPEVVWRKAGQYHTVRGHTPEGYTMLFWGRAKRNENKLLIIELAEGRPTWGVYELTSNRLLVSRGTPLAELPDGNGLVVADGRDPGQVSVVDWQGRKRSIPMAKIRNDDLKEALAAAPARETWDGKTFQQGGFGYGVSIDTERWTGVWWQAPRTLPTGERFEQLHALPDQAIVRVVRFEEVARPPERAPAMGDRKKPARLVATLKESPYWPDRYRAAEDLGKLGTAAREAVPVLVAALKDSEPFVRMAAARALANVGSDEPEPLAALDAAAKDPRPEVASAAAEAATALRQRGLRQRQADERKEGWAPRPFYRLEFLPARMRTARVLIDKSPKSIVLNPAPNGKLLAARLAAGLSAPSEGPDRILLLNSQGRILHELADPQP